VPTDRESFRKAAETAPATPDCSGERSTCRVIAKLWRSYLPSLDGHRRRLGGEALAGEKRPPAPGPCSSLPATSVLSGKRHGLLARNKAGIASREGGAIFSRASRV